MRRKRVNEMMNHKWCVRRLRYDRKWRKWLLLFLHRTAFCLPCESRAALLSLFSLPLSSFLTKLVSQSAPYSADLHLLPPSISWAALRMREWMRERKKMNQITHRLCVNRSKEKRKSDSDCENKFHTHTWFTWQVRHQHDMSVCVCISDHILVYSLF